MQNKPHILFFISEDWYFVSHRMALAEALIANGYKVSLATRVNNQAKLIKAAGIDLFHIPFHRSDLNPLHEFYVLWQLYKIYKQVKPDFVHHVAMKPVVIGSLIAKLTGVPRVINALGGLGFIFTSRAIKARLLAPIAALLLKFSLCQKNTLLILQNRDDKKTLIELGLVKEKFVRIIRGSGVEPNAYNVPPATNQPCLVVLPARMLKDKGVYEFAAAARLLRQDGVTARFALVGEPDDDNPASVPQNDLRNMVNEGFVEYWGWRKNMADVFAEADIVCLPSYREGLPKALLEAAACSRAIVTTNVPGCREIVQHDYNGLLVPARDAHLLANALRQLIQDPEKRLRFGQNGRKLVEQEFTSEKVIAATMAVYQEAMEP